MNNTSYPTLPSVPPDSDYQDKFHHNAVNRYHKELYELKKKYEDKRVKYDKRIKRCIKVQYTASTISVISGVAGVSIAPTIYALPISLTLGSIVITTSVLSGICNFFISKNEKNIKQVNQLYGIIINSIASLEITISESLNNGTLLNSNEFKKIQSVYSKAMEDISTLSKKKELVVEENFKKALLGEIGNLTELKKIEN